MLSIKEIVKDNTVYFNHYRAGYMYYDTYVNNIRYRFPVELSDLGNATLEGSIKAITLMRYINRALKDHTFVTV